MKRTLSDFLTAEKKLSSSTLNSVAPSMKKVKKSGEEVSCSSDQSSTSNKQIVNNHQHSPRASFTSDREIDGLYVIENIIDGEMERKLLSFIDSQKWNYEISRRTQHYGVSYNYGARGVKNEHKVSNVPLEFHQLLENIKSMKELNLSNQKLLEGIDFKQVIVNEYKGANQGIAKHVDHCQDFGPVILIVSLGDECIMKFHKLKTVKEEELKKKKVNRSEVTPSVVHDRKMPRRSLIILSGDARYQYQHEIPKTVVFKIDGKPFMKRTDSYRRVSITYRSLNK